MIIENCLHVSFKKFRQTEHGAQSPHFTSSHDSPLLRILFTLSSLTIRMKV